MHQQWLEKELKPKARGDFRIGRELYDEKLAFALMSPLTREDVRRRADQNAGGPRVGGLLDRRLHRRHIGRGDEDGVGLRRDHRLEHQFRPGRVADRLVVRHHPAALGDPVAVVAWLANTLGGHGIGLEAGHLVLTGALHVALPVAAGDVVTAEFDRLEDATIDAIVDNAAQTSQRSYAVMFHLGGAIQDTPEDATAYSHRHARHNLNINGVWTADHDIAEREIAWTRAFHAAVRPWESGVYTNFLDQDEGLDRIAQAFGPPTLKRLATVKHNYDPDHIFGELPPA